MQPTFNHLEVKTSLKQFAIIFLLATIICANPFEAISQATLSLQGILKKSNGTALEDGTYSIKFNIYAVNGNPNDILWDEVNPNVELNGGIYSVILGEIDDLDLPFNQDYELGVQIGSQEMTPRIRLTSAPYALALRGSTNQFPSSGSVLADTIRVAGGVIANAGAPLVNNVDGGKGYSFKNDNDSGLFSTGNGETSLYANGVERVEASTTGTQVYGTLNVQGTAGASQLNLYSSGGVNYSTSDGGSYPGWRLADIDDFSGNTQGWASYSANTNYWTAIDQGVANGGLNNPNYGVFAGHAITPTSNRQTLKKQFTIPGNYSQVMVKFRYYFLDTWDQGLGDQAYAGFASNQSGQNFRIAWRQRQEYASASTQLNQFASALSFQGQSNISDHWINGEMTANIFSTTSATFWVYFGAALDSDGTVGDESYAIGAVEIWVR